MTRPPTLHHPQGRSLQIRIATFQQSPRLPCHGVQKREDLVSRGMELGVESRVDKVEMIQEEIGEEERWDDGVFDAAAEGELEHVVGGGDVGDEDPRRVEEVDACCATPGAGGTTSWVV